MAITLHDKQIEEYMEKQKYEQDVSECKKCHILNKTVVGRNITVLSATKNILSDLNMEKL